ncbi:MAG: glycerol-3-phosphate dehydrogenase [Firmicutes bacterium]|nr:glycerol-3-phosphate dehydrogenase [Bacillota bacterium]
MTENVRLKEKVTILGCGRWATFHAWYQNNILGNDVVMWGPTWDPIYQNLESTKTNEYWDMIEPKGMPESIRLTGSMTEAIQHSDTVFVIISAQQVKDLANKHLIEKLKEYGRNKTFVMCMKGIDSETNETTSQILRRKLDENKIGGHTICAWVGPGHTQEFFEGLPGMMSIDGEDQEIVNKLIKRFSSDVCVLMTEKDFIGAELGASAKNVYGIAAGMLDGLRLVNLKGPLMARAIKELKKLIVAMGGKPATSSSISHVGDFDATFYSKNSNNRRYGEQFVTGELKEGHKLAEGVETTKAMMALSKKHDIKMPIVTAVHGILFEEKDARKTLTDGIRGMTF